MLKTSSIRRALDIPWKNIFNHDKQPMRDSKRNLWISSPLNREKNRKTGIVFMNMGGPRTVSETGDFLHRLFRDRDLIQLPFQSTIAPLIAKRRTPRIEEQYSKIGGGSPILRWTNEQAQGMIDILDRISPDSAPHKAYVAFRYARPLTEECLSQMLDDGIQDAVAFSQYPQYSCSTTGSSLNELYRQIQKLPSHQQNQISWSVLDRWPTHPGLIEAFATHIERSLETYDYSIRSKVILLFSAHSLPMSVVNRGDSYPSEVAATVHAVMQRLRFSNPYKLVWQSQVGPSAWLGPQTSDTIKGYAKKGVNDMLLIPIAFTSDHIETLFELDLEYIEEAKEMGLTGVKRVESLNDDPIFIKALADLISSHLKTRFRLSTTAKDSSLSSKAEEDCDSNRQMRLRCPDCVNPICLKSKTYFSGRQHTVY
ncbi:hypothetical protein BY996DRAFT_4632527 [Phakopsora pachyrhizi]|nr:hypothetical protein BY996DRAFT_4632527 [Phakopsora pachyrhizi]